MKTKRFIGQISKAFLGLYSVLFLVNCSNNDGGGNNSNTAAAYYQYIGNQCYQNTNNSAVVVSPTYCQGTNTFYQMVGSQCMLRSANGTTTRVSAHYCQLSNGTGAYQMIGNRCYQNTNGATTEVPLTYCQNLVSGGQYNTGVCSGPYTDGYQVVNCGTQYNCAGHTLMNYHTQQVVNCQ